MTGDSIQEDTVIPQVIKLNRDQTRILNDAEKAMGILHQTFEHWLAAGRAFYELQQEAVLRSNSSGPSGRAYSDWYEAVHEQHLAKRPHLAKVGKTGRSLAIWMVNNEEEVRHWRDTVLDDDQQLSWNSPSTIKREFTAWQHESIPLPLDPEEPVSDKDISDIFPPDEFDNEEGDGDDGDTKEPPPRKKGKRRTNKDRKTTVKEMTAIIGAQSEEIVQLKGVISRLRTRIRELESQLKRAGISIEVTELEDATPF